MKGQSAKFKLFLLSLSIAVTVAVTTSCAATPAPLPLDSSFDGDYTLRIFRISSSTKRSELLQLANFQVIDSQHSIIQISDFTQSNTQAMRDLTASRQPDGQLRLSATMNTLFNKHKLGRFRADFDISGPRPRLTDLREYDMARGYTLDVTLIKRELADSVQAAASNQTSVENTGSLDAQIRAAQTILARMDLYNGQYTGHSNIALNRALTTAMRQMGISEQPTVDNFLSAVVGRLVAADELIDNSIEIAELAEIRGENDNLRQQLQLQDRLLEQRTQLASQMSAELESFRTVEPQLAALREQNTNLQRQLSAANETVADLREGIASDEPVRELQRQLDAANETVANLRDEMAEAYVPIEDHQGLQRQISALNASNSEVRERIQTDYVPRSEYSDLQNSSMMAQESLRNQLAALNQTIAELRNAIQTEFIPLQDHLRLERQVSALNSTILDLQDRNDIQRNRMLESEALFRNFRDDCAGSPECARAMRLE